jgi:signal transduction histidine kinase
MEGSDGLPRRVRVSSALADRQVTVSVSDNGVGLRGVNVSQIFALSYTTKATGTGVGLALSRSIIEAHGGKLWGEQNADRGATFSFTVPAVAAAVGADTLIVGQKAI